MQPNEMWWQPFETKPEAFSFVLIDNRHHENWHWNVSLTVAKLYILSLFFLWIAYFVSVSRCLKYGSQSFDVNRDYKLFFAVLYVYLLFVHKYTQNFKKSS